MPASKTFFYLLGSFLFGVLLDSNRISIILLLAALSILVSFYPKRSIIAFMILLVALGSFWPSNFRHRAEEQSYFKGTVIREPDIRETHSRFFLSGGVLLVTQRDAGHQYGDILEVRGKISPPSPIEGFDYPGYLAKEGLFLVAYYPDVRLVGRESLILDRIFEIKKRAIRSIDRHFPEPHASVLAALVLGEKKMISDVWQEKMNISGVRHIISVSGLHVAVVASILLSLTARLGKRFSSIIVMSSLFLFTVITGLQPSAIRAAIMGSSTVLSGLLGRMNRPHRSLVLAASIMLVFNPLLLKHDIGFQLSFLAVIGIVWLSPIIKQKIPIRSEMIKDSLAISLSAYILTLPLVVHYFGKASIIFPVTNLLIVPVLYPIMILGLLFIFASFVFSPLAFASALPLWAFLTYLTSIINLFSKFSWASISFNNLTLFLFFWVFLFILTYGKKSEIGIE